MEMSEIQKTLASKEYSFLESDKNLGKNIILLTTGGSHAYGTNVETSDLDIRGIAIERKEEVFGLSAFEQFENKETDTTIYGLRKMISLLLNSNPNVLEMLGTRPDQLFVISEEGKLLRENSGLFLSQKATNSFGGYATAQLRRLQNALARDEYPQPQKEQHILNSLETQMVHLKNTYKEFTDEEINLYIDKSDKEDFETEIFIDINLKHYPLRDFKNIYSEMGNVIKDYGQMNHRNRKKDELHLLKHAMHLIRLLEMGSEILEGKGINTYRTNADFLLRIRSGEFTYDQIFEMVDECEKKFNYAKNNTSLPKNPNFKKVEELLMSIYEKRFR